MDLIDKSFPRYDVYNSNKDLKENIQQYRNVIEQKVNILNLLEELSIKEKRQKEGETDGSVNKLYESTKEKDQEIDNALNAIDDLIITCDNIMDKITNINNTKSVIIDVQVNTSFVVPKEVNVNYHKEEFGDLADKLKEIKTQLENLRKDFRDEKKLIVLLDKYRKRLEEIKIEYSKLKKLHGQAVNNSIIVTHSKLKDDFNK